MQESLLSAEEVKVRLEWLEINGFPPADVKRVADNLATYCHGATAEAAFLQLVDRMTDEVALVEVMDHLAKRIWPNQKLSLNTDSRLLLSGLASRGFDEASASKIGVQLCWQGFAVQETWRKPGTLESRDETAAIAAVKVLGIVHMRIQQGRSEQTG